MIHDFFQQFSVYRSLPRETTPSPLSLLTNRVERGEVWAPIFCNFTSQSDRGESLNINLSTDTESEPSPDMEMEEIALQSQIHDSDLEGESIIAMTLEEKVSKSFLYLRSVIPIKVNEFQISYP